MNLRDRVMNLVETEDVEEATIKTFTIVQREFKMSRQELIDTPIPSYLKMIDILIKENKQSSKSKGQSFGNKFTGADAIGVLKSG